jgi:hypothetical protein
MSIALPSFIAAQRRAHRERDDMVATYSAVVLVIAINVFNGASVSERVTRGDCCRRSSERFVVMTRDPADDYGEARYGRGRPFAARSATRHPSVHARSAPRRTRDRRFYHHETSIRDRYRRVFERQAVHLRATSLGTPTQCATARVPEFRSGTRRPARCQLSMTLGALSPYRGTRMVG